MRTTRTDFYLPLVAALLVAAIAGVPTLAQLLSEKPNAGAMTEAYLQGLDANPLVKYVSSSAGTTPVDLVGSDPLTSAQRTVRYAQLVTVTNLSTSGSVCVHAMDWGDTCSSETAACASGTNDRPIVPAGQSRTFVYEGTVDLCGVASGAGVAWQAEVVGRLAGAR